LNIFSVFSIVIEVVLAQLLMKMGLIAETDPVVVALR
jgi:hypothetical protein